MPSTPLFPFQEDPGEAEPGNQEVPRRDTSCRRYGNGPRLPGRLARDPASSPPAPPASPAAATLTAAAAAAAIFARPWRPLPDGTCAPLPRSRRPRGRASRAAVCARLSPGSAAGSRLLPPTRRRGRAPGQDWRPGPGTRLQGTARKGLKVVSSSQVERWLSSGQGRRTSGQELGLCSQVAWLAELGHAI